MSLDVAVSANVDDAVHSVDVATIMRQVVGTTRCRLTEVDKLQQTLSEMGPVGERWVELQQSGHQH